MLITPDCLPRAGKAPSTVDLRRFPLILLAVFFLASRLAQAAGADPDDLYLRIFGLMDQANTLTTGGHTERAIAKYRQAQAELQRLQRDFPEWNPKIVSYRVQYLAQKVDSLTHNAPEQNAPATSTAPANAPQIKLLEPGAEPRVALRLHPKPDDKQILTMTIKMGMEMKLGEAEAPETKIPPMKMVVDMTAKSLSPEGDITYASTVQEAGISEDADVNQQVAEAMKSSLDAMKGLAASGVMTSRGINKSSEIKGGDENNPQVRQVTSQLKETLANFSTPFPEEPVGVGAKWESKKPVNSQGMKIDQTTTYELVSVEGDRIALRSTISQTAAPQKIQNPAMPGLKLDLTKLSSTGNGDFSLDLGHLAPLQGAMSSKSDISMGMSVAGQKQSMDMKMDLSVQMKSE